MVSTKKKSVRASTMSSLRELESTEPRPGLGAARDRSWGRSSGQLRPAQERPAGRQEARRGVDSAPLESPRLSR